MPNSLKNAITSGKNGLLIRNAIFLPFHMELLSVWIGKDMSLVSRPDLITHFSENQGELYLQEALNYTRLVFLKHKDLKKEYGQYKGHVILHVTEKGADIFDPNEREYIKLSFHDDTENVYLELLKDPLDL